MECCVADRRKRRHGRGYARCRVDIARFQLHAFIMRVLTVVSVVSVVASFLFADVVVGEEAVEKRKLFGHEAIDLVARQFGKLLPAPASAKTSTTRSSTRVITWVTPSPSAKPIPITAQYQTVTSFVPKITLCALPPIAHVTGSFPNPGHSFPPFLNYSRIVPTGTGTCLTEYSPTVTPICHTTLAGLASRVTVSDCTQEITFLKDTDYELQYITRPALLPRAIATPSPSPYVQRVDKYYIVDWDELTQPGVAPSEVEEKMCRSYPNGTEVCISNLQQWRVSTVTKIRTVTKIFDITTIVRGPVEVMVETLQATVTAKETVFSLSTNMAVAYGVETETTIISNLTATKTATETNTWTRQVGYNTGKPSSVRAKPAKLPSDFPSAWFPMPEGVAEETYVFMRTLKVYS